MDDFVDHHSGEYHFVAQIYQGGITGGYKAHTMRPDCEGAIKVLLKKKFRQILFENGYRVAADANQHQGKI